MEARRRTRFDAVRRGASNGLESNGAERSRVESRLAMNAAPALAAAAKPRSLSTSAARCVGRDRFFLSFLFLFSLGRASIVSSLPSLVTAVQPAPMIRETIHGIRGRSGLQWFTVSQSHSRFSSRQFDSRDDDTRVLLFLVDDTTSFVLALAFAFAKSPHGGV